MGRLVRLLDEMSRAAGVKKPTGSQKARALLRVKAARDGGEEFFLTQSEKTTFEGRNETRLELWEEHIIDPLVALDRSFEVCGKSVSRLTVGSRLVVDLVFNGLWRRGLRHGVKDVGQTFEGKSLALLGSLGQCAFAHSLHASECPKERTAR